MCWMNLKRCMLKVDIQQRREQVQTPKIEIIEISDSEDKEDNA